MKTTSILFSILLFVGPQAISPRVFSAPLNCESIFKPAEPVKFAVGTIIEASTFAGVIGGKFRVEIANQDGSVELSRWEDSHVLYKKSDFEGRYAADDSLLSNHVKQVLYIPPKFAIGMIFSSGAFTYLDADTKSWKQSPGGKFRVEQAFENGAVQLSRWEDSHVIYEASDYKGRYTVDRDLPLKQKVVVNHSPQPLKRGMIVSLGNFVSRNPVFGPDKNVMGGKFRVEAVVGGSIELSRWENSHVLYEASRFSGRFFVDANITQKQVVRVEYDPPTLKTGMIVRMGSFLSKDPAFGKSKTALAGTFRVERVNADGSVELSRFEKSSVLYQASTFSGTYYTEPNPQLRHVIVVERE